jgi:hemoglobin
MDHPLPASASAHPWGGAATPFDEIGGEPVLRRLVDAFYDRIRDEAPSLRAMHPADDSGSRSKLFWFLSGWMGGPPLYEEQRGHPRLRMRHAPFPIDTDAARGWLACMFGAMDDAGIAGDARAYLEVRFVQTALHLRSTDHGAGE